MSPPTVGKVGRLLLTRGEAAEALSMSLSHFQRHVQPHLRLVRSGSKRLVQVAEIQSWIAANTDY